MLRIRGAPFGSGAGFLSGWLAELCTSRDLCIFGSRSCLLASGEVRVRIHQGWVPFTLRTLGAQAAGRGFKWNAVFQAGLGENVMPRMQLESILQAPLRQRRERPPQWLCCRWASPALKTAARDKR